MSLKLDLWHCKTSMALCEPALQSAKIINIRDCYHLINQKQAPITLCCDICYPSDMHFPKTIVLQWYPFPTAMYLSARPHRWAGTTLIGWTGFTIAVSVKIYQLLKQCLHVKIDHDTTFSLCTNVLCWCAFARTLNINDESLWKILVVCF